MSKKKSIILISSLVAFLAVCVLLYIFVILPLLDEDGDEDEIPEIIEGEGLYLGTRITMYPEIAQDKVYSIEIKNEKSSYTFKKIDGKGMCLVGYEDFGYDKLYYSYLLAYVRLPLTYEDDVYRDLTDKQMAEYGLTKETCKAQYKITYYDENSELKSHSAYVGHRTFSDDETYYAAVEGRNCAYRLQGETDNLFLALEEILTPNVISSGLNANETISLIDKFLLMRREKGENSELSTQTVLSLSQKDGGNLLDGYYFDMMFDVKLAGGRTKRMNVDADSTYVEDVFQTLYGSLVGESVEVIRPSDEDLKKYGLDKDSPCYVIQADFVTDEDSEIDSTLQISMEQDGYYYINSAVYGENNTFIVKIPKDTLYFLSTDENELFEWAATHSITSCFFEYLESDGTQEQPGMKEITITAQDKNADGSIKYTTTEVFTVLPEVLDNEKVGIIVTAKNTGNRYATINEKTGENLFASYYALLLYYPAPSEFNKMSSEEIAKIKADKSNLVFELVTRNNNDKLLRYSYYQINNGLTAVMETCEGRIENGQEVWDTPDISYNVTLGHLNTLREYFKKLLNNEYFDIYEVVN